MEDYRLSDLTEGCLIDGVLSRWRDARTVGVPYRPTSSRFGCLRKSRSENPAYRNKGYASASTQSMVDEATTKMDPVFIDFSPPSHVTAGYGMLPDDAVGRTFATYSLRRAVR